VTADFLLGAAAALLFVIPFDWYVAAILAKEAAIEPHIDSLTGSAFGRITVAISATLAALVAVHAVVLMRYGVRLIPTPWPVIMLFAAVFVVSLPNAYFLVLIRRWRKRRNGEAA
jgi:hypothetical protein